MKLSATHELTLADCRLLSSLPVLLEAGEGPKWDFDYANYKQDPHPSILVLGAYQHPNTGNNLVGGINLNYLNQQQRNDLARVLPKLMQQSNLYQRYHQGKKLLPGVFDNYYRTYNAAHIRGVTAGVMHPRYGMLQASKDFFKKKIGGLFKSKAQRAKDLEPKFPSDLSGMKDALDQAVNQLGLEVAKGEEEPDTPEMQAALANFQKYKADKARSMNDIEAEEDEPFLQADQNYQMQQLATGQATPAQVRMPHPQQSLVPNPSLAAPAAQQSYPQPQPAPPPTPQEMGQEIDQERQENQQELMDPNNAIDLDGDGVPDEDNRLQESIVYYCPVAKRYLMESVGQVIREWEEEGTNPNATAYKPIPPAEEEDEEWWGAYTNPDFNWKSRQSIPFIYTAAGEMLYGQPGTPHFQMFQDQPELLQKFIHLVPPKDLIISNSALRQRLLASRVRDELDKVALCGRIQDVAGQRTVSFWKDQPFLKDCLQKLLDDNLIDDQTFVSTPKLETIPLAKVGVKKERQLSATQEADFELHRQLHLMRGDEKREAMKKLGVGVGGRPHPMQQALTAKGLLGPGQKWWAPNSEGKNRGQVLSDT